MEATRTTTKDDDAQGKKRTTATPKSNADFRNFLLSNGRNEEENTTTTTTTTKEEKDLPDVGAFPNRKKKKKANQQRETTTKTRRDENNTPRYRDRAKERREMEEEDQDDDDGDEGRRADNQRDKSNTFATTTRGGVFEHAFEDEDRLTTKTTTINTNSKRLMDIEKSKYMGGDEKTTHKVKGLDFALLRKKREELFEMKKENLEEEEDDDDEEEEVVVVEDEDDAQNNNPSSSGFSSLYDAKSNLGRILVSKIETAQKRNKDALTKRTKIPPLSGVSYLYDVNSRTREVTRTIEMETKPRADIEEERKARRREFAKISKDEEKILRAVAKAIREPRGTKEEEKKDSHNIAPDNSNANAEGKKIDTTNAAADSDSEDIFADVGKDYDAIAELKKEEEQNGKKEATTTAAKKESRTKLFDGEALLEEFETGPRKADENIKKMDEAYERKRLEERAEMDDDAYGEYYPGFDAGFGGEIDDDDDGDTDRDKDKDKDTGEEEKGKKGKKKKELTEAQKMKQKENEAYQAMQKHMKEKYSDKYDAAFGVVKKKEDNENNEAEDTKTEEEKEGVAGGKRAKRLKI